MNLQAQITDSPLITCSTRAEDPVAAVAELRAAIGEVELAGALLFCSHTYPRDALAQALNTGLPGLPLIGCTSAGEVSDRGYDSDSLVFIGFPAQDFSIAALRFDALDHLTAKARSARSASLSPRPGSIMPPSPTNSTRSRCSSSMVSPTARNC